jgi:acetoacetyl-CoA synthetase
MLQCRSESKIALIEASSVIFILVWMLSTNLLCPSYTVEPTPEHSLQLRSVTYAQLYDIVRDVVSALLYHGLRPGDRVASYSSNCIVRVFFSWRQWIYFNSQICNVRQM